ncbi:DNA sulfur modification protein DndB [Acaryochloris sp. CCMEE 5410]|uniref:DNA sulfur modification protein DndB n=1 Tax=Acaryochloris sp. CCMEE 5410 TaxID=310037 RepID=UPI000248514E|nr:DNA sulfur modification protein DndB [Acaryochloris sp. CCMEE 5410]
MVEAAGTQLPLLVDPVDLKHVANWPGPIALDSGAYRAFKSKSLINIEQYLAAAFSRPFDFVVAPDVIGNPEQSYQNWLKVKDLSLNILPAWEWGSDQSYLHHYLDHAPVVGIGGLVPVMRMKNSGSERKIKDQMLAELKQMCLQYPARFHIFGMNWLWAIESLNSLVFSGDSSKWLDGARYGHLIFTNSRTGHLSQAPAKALPESQSMDRQDRCISNIQAIANFTQAEEPQNMATSSQTKTTPSAKEKASSKKETTPCYQFPAVSGIQSGQPYYTTMIPIKLLPKFFVLETETMPAEMRAQRQLNSSRARKLSAYVLAGDYTLSSVVVTVELEKKDAKAFQFDPVQGELGMLNVPMSSRFLIADGQHRIHGLKLALEENPEIGEESISCVVFLHSDLDRAQQIFHDLNFYASKPNKSITSLYNHKSESAEIARLVMVGVPIFRQYTDTEKTSCSKKSLKVFTFNAIEEASHILSERLTGTPKQKAKLICAFFKLITEEITEWSSLIKKSTTSSEIRQDFICCHAIALIAIARAGATCIHLKNWRESIQSLALGQVNWTKTNPDWENLIIFGGRIHKNQTTAGEFAQYLLQRGVPCEEVIQASMKDWLSQHFHGYTKADIENQLGAKADILSVLETFLEEKPIQADDPTLKSAWFNARTQFLKVRGIFLLESIQKGGK